MRPRAVAATILLLAAALAVAWAFLVLLSGGFTLGKLVSRDPIRPSIVAAILAAIARVASPVDFDATVARIVRQHDRWPARIAAIAAVASFIVATAWNTRAAGGSDSSCYVLQADAFAHGHATLSHPLARELPDAPPEMFAPTGFVPSPKSDGSSVPICAPGLALFMAPALWIGTPLVFLVVPLCAAIAVWLTFVFGRQVADDVAGAAAAVLLACSPIFLYQAVQPMSDVPATALWMGALTGCARGDRRGAIAGGICASLAVLTRPNLAVAIVPLLWLLRDRGSWVRFALAAVPGVAVLAALNAVRYGSPLATGYGSAGGLFATANVIPNVVRYGRWMMETETPLVVLAVAGPVVLTGRRRRVAFVALLSCAFVFATYALYTVFDDWWYLRFLAPIVPVMLVLGVATVVRAIPPESRRARSTAAAILCLVLGTVCIFVAAGRQVFDLQRLESRFVQTGAFAARELPPDAVVLAVQQSGSVRFYARRPTIAWDAIPAGRLDAFVDELQRRGYRVFAALEDAEIQPFRERFAGQRLGPLEVRPAAEIAAAVHVRVYALAHP